MDMDKRQQQIKEGAGLTESRLNTDFIDLLRKYSTPALLVVAAISLGFLAYRKYNEYRETQLNTAWVEYDSARTSGNPTNLVTVAQTHSGLAGIPLLARLEAGDIWRRASLTGVAPGGKIERDGKVLSADDMLNADQRKQMLDKAEEQFKIVVDAAGSNKNLVYHSVPALFRLAAIAEMRQKWDDSKILYERIAKLADDAKLPGLAEVARERLGSIDELKNPVRLYTDAEVVTRPPPAPSPFLPPDLEQLPSPIMPDEVPAGLVPLPGGPPIPVTPPAGTSPGTTPGTTTPPAGTPAPAPGNPPPAPAPAETPKR